MAGSTAKGFPYPTGPDDNDNHDAIKNIADRLDTILTVSKTAAQINALAGTDLWTGRLLRQSDATGTGTRTAAGLYAYDGSAWQPVSPESHPSGFASSPTLKGSTADPNMGTSPTQRWEWSLIGPGICVATVEFVWGTGSPTPGTGDYFFTLPRPSRAFVDATLAAADPGGRRVVGAGTIKDVSASSQRPVLAVASLDGLTTKLITSGHTIGSFVTGASPITLGAAGDWIRLALRYFCT